MFFNFINLFFIRLLDIVLSIIAIMALLPLFVCVIVLLSVTGEKKVFFLQTRIGKNGQKFSLIKFVTMQANSPNVGTKDITIRNDPRILPFGRILRKTKINELPQLLNVIIGDMSLIGFRPHTPSALEEYSIDDLNVVLTNKPGLSGFGSLEFSNEEDLLPSDPKSAKKYYKDVIVPQKVYLEKIWNKRKSLLIYVLAIIATIIKIPFGLNILKIIIPEWNNSKFH